MDTVYGTKYIGNVISWCVFLFFYNYLKHFYFYFLAIVCLVSVFTALLIHEEHKIPEKIDFFIDLKLCIDAIKKNKL